jgi:heme/copper-type cytochrome/quinol oxidase subunit 2
MDRSSTVLAALIIAALVVALTLGYYFGNITAPSKTSTSSVSTTTTTTTQTTSSSSSNSSSPYVLTLVITTNNLYNSTFGDQPAYYVLGPNGLQSSANISLPAHRLIKLVIICYDNGSATLLGPQYANVNGTQNKMETVVTNDNVNSSQGSSGIKLSGGQNVSSVSADNVAHTFTVPQIGLNLPIEPSSTVSAYFTLNQTGTFFWFCMTECGFGPTGQQGAMDTPGWMSGNLVVS